jgi:acyl-CoA hydrolase
MVNTPLFEITVSEPTDIEAKIGRNVASLVEDGATLQMGTEGIPNAALNFLHGHKTWMFTLK